MPGRRRGDPITSARYTPIKTAVMNHAIANGASVRITLPIGFALSGSCVLTPPIVKTSRSVTSPYATTRMDLRGDDIDTRCNERMWQAYRMTAKMRNEP